MRDEIDTLVDAANPATEAEVQELPTGRAEAHLLEEIMSTPVLDDVGADQPRTRRLTGRRVTTLAGAAALVASVGFVVQTGNDPNTSWAAEVLEVAESAPRVLIDEPGWTITRADEFSADEGEMTFSTGEQELDVHWRPAATHDDYVDDRRHSAGREEATAVLGHEATLFQYEGTTDFTTLWLDGNHSVEARGTFGSLEDYQAILGALHAVDVDTWLVAMPESVVQPMDAEHVVAEMLADIPTPDGFDPGALTTGSLPRDRYQLGAIVTSEVTCAWSGQWIAARESGDQAAEDEAAQAMGTSREWAILHEMDADGDHPDTVWQLAEVMASGITDFGEPIDVDYVRSRDHCSRD